MVKSYCIHFSGVALNPRGGKFGEFRVKNRDRDGKCIFICSAHNTPKNIFGTSKTTLTNPTQRYPSSTSCRGEIVSSQEKNESTSIGILDLGHEK